ncbi:hypothetical protein FPV67DRAFT_1786827 [Lyophyllum atratum]|nr:hypothetical protein FPV67DRAFT_1786827 [Lyophyllum atratum]
MAGPPAHTPALGEPPARCPSLPLPTDDERDEPASQSTENGAPTSQSLFETLPAATTARSLQLFPTAQVASPVKSSAEQQRDQALWDFKRGEALAAALDSTTNPKSGSPTHLPPHDPAPTRGSSPPPAPPPKRARLTRSLTLNSLDPDDADTDVRTPTSSPGKGTKRSLSSTSSSHSPTMQAVAKALQLILPPTKEKETLTNGLARTNTNIAAIANHVMTLRNDVDDAKSVQTNEVRRLAGEVSTTQVTQRELSTSLASLTTQVTDVRASVSEVKTDIRELRHLGILDFDTTIDGAPHDLVAVSRSVGIVRDEAHTELQAVRDEACTNTTAVREQLELVMAAAQNEFNAMRSQSASLEAGLGQLGMRLTEVLDQLQGIDRRVSEVAEHVSTVDNTLGQRVVALEAEKERNERRYGELERKSAGLERSGLIARESLARLELSARAGGQAAHIPPAHVAPSPAIPAPRPVSFGAAPLTTPPQPSPVTQARGAVPTTVSPGSTAPSLPAARQAFLNAEPQHNFSAFSHLVHLSPISTTASADSPASLLQKYVRHGLGAGYPMADFHADVDRNKPTVLVIGFRDAAAAATFVRNWENGVKGELKSTRAALVPVRVEGRKGGESRRGGGARRGGAQNGGPARGSSSRASVQDTDRAELMSLVARTDF